MLTAIVMSRCYVAQSLIFSRRVAFQPCTNSPQPACWVGCVGKARLARPKSDKELQAAMAKQQRQTDARHLKTLKVSVYKGTWLDRPGTCTTYHLDKDRYGLRVCEHALDGRPTSVRLIEGDGRTSKFVVHAEGEF